MVVRIEGEIDNFIKGFILNNLEFIFFSVVKIFIVSIEVLIVEIYIVFIVFKIFEVRSC